MSNDSNNNADFYKETVFLPKTDFPMRGELPKKEPAMVQKWQDMKLHDKIREQSQGVAEECLFDGGEEMKIMTGCSGTDL